jgi:hypothetical protein
LLCEQEPGVMSLTIIDVITKRSPIKKNNQPNPIVKTTACNTDVAGMHRIEISEILFD